MNVKGDASLITNDVLCHLIESEEVEIFKEIFQYDFYNYYFIKELLFIYKNKTVFSDKELQSLFNKILIKINRPQIKQEDYLSLSNVQEKYNYPLLSAIKKNNITIVKLLMEYAKENNIVLNINDKNNNEEFPFLSAIKFDNKNDDTKMVDSLMEYAKENNIVLNINDKNNNDEFPLLLAIDNKNDNIYLVHSLMEYAKEII